MDRVMSMILAGGVGERLSVLVEERAKPAVPFGGRYRIIDFALSNCVNSKINNIAVLTQYNPRSLAKHIGVGRPWDLDRAKGGISIFQPFLSRSERDWYKGTADAVYQNLYAIEDMKIDEVLILAGDHIYIMRYDRMIDTHRNRGADVTVAVTEIPRSETSRFGIITLDHNERIVDFVEKPKSSKSGLASMGIYVFNQEILIDCLERDSQGSGSHDFGKDILPYVIGKYKVFGYKFRGYWRDVGTVDSYWQANMDLLVDLPELNLYNPETEIMSIQENLPPVKTGSRAQVKRSLVANGAIVNGYVENSVIFSRVFIEDDAVIKDSIVFNDTTIGKGVTVDRAIIDKQVWIGPGSYIGYSDDFSPNRSEPEHLTSGITVIGKGARLPANTKIGHNCKIGCWIDSGDLPSNVIESGETIEKKKVKRHIM
jgi:glucose-1-phosphate adenylyltransferase